jgi:poly(3-hydroxybutyrate) depolymerase
MRMVNVLISVLVAGLGLPAAAPQQVLPEGIKHKFLRSGRETESYYVYIPPKAPKDTPLPLMLVVAAENENGMNDIAGWATVAEANNVILVGPNIGSFSADWDRLYDHPEWIHQAIEDTRKEHPVDGRRMYAWGDSSGGAFAMYLAFLESNYFAAAAVHGAVIRNFRYQMADLAARKIPIAYYIGTRDPVWRLEQTRAVRDALTTRGFPLHYVELKGADHNFFAHRDDVVNDAWEYLTQYALEAEPKFEPLDLAKIKQALH